MLALKCRMCGFKSWPRQMLCKCKEKPSTTSFKYEV